jgi:hypothetical protein
MHDLDFMQHYNVVSLDVPVPCTKHCSGFLMQNVDVRDRVFVNEWH